MPLHPDGYWIPNLSPKQIAIQNNRARYQLVSGPRLSGKSWGVEHAVVKHLWITKNARMGAFARTIKSAKVGGSYDDLTKLIIPEWLSANLTGVNASIRFEYSIPPKQMGDTRTNYFKIRNYWGGESEFYLFSLDYDDDIEEKVKNTRFSGFWFIELTNFDKREVFSATVQQLRMPGLPWKEHLWIADTNPDYILGEDSWIYKLFYEKQGYDPVVDKEEIENLSVIEVMIDDNPFLEPQAIRSLKANYAYSPEKTAAYIFGKWVKGMRDGHFSDVLLPNIHFQGDVSSNDSAKWQIIVPTEQTMELMTGWDLGDVNHSAHIAQKRPIDNDEYAYDFIDELFCIDRQVSIREFTEAFLERMDHWEKFMREAFGRTVFRWRHWSDTSAFSYKSAVGGDEEKIVRNVSKGRITLLGIDKRSVTGRVDQVRRLLHEQRIFVSANLTHTTVMLKTLYKGKSKLDFILPATLKHSFDSFSYLLRGEEPHDLERGLPQTEQPARLVLVPA